MIKNKEPLAVKIDAKTHLEFRIWCIRNHTTMTKVLETLIQEKVNEK